MKRRAFITLIGGAAVWPLAARAQQQGTPLIGILSLQSQDGFAPMLAAVRQGLSETGYIEGQNVAIEYRWADNQEERLSALAADLVRRQVSVIVAGSTLPALAAKAATTAIPIVFTVGDDPVKSGLVASFNRPGGNVTGVNFFSGPLVGKRLGLLHELAPSTAVIAVLINPNSPFAEDSTKDVQEAASIRGQKIEVLHASNGREIDAIFVEVARMRADALLVINNTLFTSRRVQIITLATRRGIPAIYTSREFAEAGGLISYGPNLADAQRQAGNYVGRILKGAKPADLPVVQPTKFELVINLNTAKALGLTVPPTLLAIADEVIE